MPAIAAYVRATLTAPALMLALIPLGALAFPADAAGEFAFAYAGPAHGRAYRLDTPAQAPSPVAAGVPRLGSFAVQPGGAVTVHVPDRPPAPGARPLLMLEQEPVPLWRGPRGWRGLVAVSYWTRPGTLQLTSGWRWAGTVLARQRLTLRVQPRDFPRQHLRVSRGLASKRSRERLRADSRRTRAARSQSRPQPLWSGTFGWPLGGVRTTAFGEVRLINGTPVGRHSGLDLAAPRGTPVLAPAAGRVTLARRLYVTGHTIILDHGLGLSTSYAHLSAIGVREGQWLAKGRVIGRVGSTGFSTGPHLHWSARVGHTPVDPEALLQGPLADDLRDLARALPVAESPYGAGPHPR